MLWDQLPISPPSSFVITRHAERGRPPKSPSGQELNSFGLAWLVGKSLGLRPGAGCPRTLSFRRA